MVSWFGPEEWQAFALTLQLAAITTVGLIIIGIPLAWALARFDHPLKSVFDAIIALPLVLPPTVLGFYLLIAFAPDSMLGNLWQQLFDRRLAFSFDALVLGSMLYSLPFVVQPIQQAFSRIPEQQLEVFKSMGLNRWQRLYKLILPSCKAAIISAFALGFAHTIGEFGVVLMIGGNIAGETQVISIALYDHVETLNYQKAHGVSIALLVFSFLILLLTYSKLQSPFRIIGMVDNR